MRFKRIRSFLLCFFTCATLLSCGEKKPAEKNLLPGKNSGCFDQLGDRVKRYFDGSIENAEWQDTFDCVNDQVTFFKKYVRGNSPDGYNQSDIAALVRQFLITSRPLSDAFIASIFDIKASVFGGTAGIITPKELDEFLALSQTLRVETTKLLPALQAKHRSPNGPNLLALSDGLGVFGGNLATYLKTLKGTIAVRKESFLPFVREIIELHGGDPTLVDRYGDFVRNLKVVVTGGTADVIEPSTWPAIIQQGSSFAGLLLAYRDMEDQIFTAPGDKDQFQIDIARRAQIAINRVIALHGAGIPLELFDPVIDTIPWDALSLSKRAAIKHDLRPMVMRAMKGGVPGYLNTAAVGTVIDLFENGTRKQIHLKRIYASLPTSPSKADFEASARKYLINVTTTQDRADVNNLIAISKTFIGLFPEDSGEMVFRQDIREVRTENHMEHMSWFQTAIQHLLSVYATGPVGANSRPIAKVDDLANLTSDFNQILIQWKLSSAALTPMEMAKKRFREANLFMPVSNGDAYMDEVEGTYYLGFLFSASSLSHRMFDGVTHNAPAWSACPITGKDDLGSDAVDAPCFRNIYFNHPEVFWNNFPGLQTTYAAMDPDQKADLAMSMEIASRVGGYSEKPIGPYDVDSFGALPHYVEDVMERFDLNNDELLDKEEILDHAYPIFKKTLQDSDAVPAAAKKSDFLLKGILTYLMKYGKPPNGTLDLLGWCARLPFTKIEAQRGAVYKVVAILALPPKPSKTSSASPANVNLFPSVHSQ
jgi:hypothetical protein